MAVADHPDVKGTSLQVQHLVQDVYEASLSPQRLQQAMDRVTEALNGDLGVLLIRNETDDDLSLMVTSKSRIASADDSEASPAWGAGVAGGWPSKAWMNALWPQGEAVTQQNRGDWPQPVGGGVSAALVAPVGSQGALAFFRRMPQPHFDDTECAMLQSLASQLGHAVSLLAQIAKLQQRAAIAEEMLDLVATPLLLVNGQGRLISANTYGRVALELRDGIALVDGQVCAQALRSNGRLQALISDVAAAAGQGQYRAQALSLSRGADRRPLGLTLRPLRPRSSWDLLGGAGGEAALVVIDLSALDLQDPPRPWLLQDLFNLTPAEASLLHALMQDKRIEDHAQARGVSVTTVRTQLAHLFRKTGTNRQSELVRMASRAVGGLRVDDDEPGGRQDR